MALDKIYDARYAGDYRASLSGYEIARWAALEHFLTRVSPAADARRVMDYGAGRGLHVPLWERLFPNAELHFCDIGSVAAKRFREEHPAHVPNFHPISGLRAEAPDASFDLVVSIEVMEHVEELDAYLADIHRLLKPGGRFVWTTPCANRFSIEHLYAAATGTIDPTPNGSRRWRWEDPTHLRRLTSREAEGALAKTGFGEVRFRYRAHLFSFVCTYLPTRHLRGLRDRAMLLDYALFRRLPNGASMIGCAYKKTAP